jgi:hypothetical protein
MRNAELLPCGRVEQKLQLQQCRHTSASSGDAYSLVEGVHRQVRHPPVPAACICGAACALIRLRELNGREPIAASHSAHPLYGLKMCVPQHHCFKNWKIVDGRAESESARPATQN